MLEVDHVILAVRDLDAAAQRLYDEHGLASVPGGRHPGWGTANRIVPLGSSYVELLAVVDEDEAAGSALGRWVAAEVVDADRLIGWCVRTDDLDAVATARALTPEPGARTLPDGSRLTWRAALRGDSDPTLPFFIQWDSPAERLPGRASAGHRVEVEGIAWVLVEGVPERIRAWLGDETVPVRITEGAPRLAGVAIATAEGTLVLR